MPIHRQLGLLLIAALAPTEVLPGPNCLLAPRTSSTFTLYELELIYVDLGLRGLRFYLLRREKLGRLGPHRLGRCRASI